MISSPVDIAIAAAVVLLIFGPRERPKPPGGGKRDTFERTEKCEGPRKDPKDDWFLTYKKKP